MYIKSVTRLYYYATKFCEKKDIVIIAISCSMQYRLRVETYQKKFSVPVGNTRSEKIELG
jgi:hypothetical protein